MRHWADGGPCDTDNAALLCQWHHTFVHTHRLWADVMPRPDEQGRYVVWDLHPGSYDRELDQLARQRAQHDPPPMTRQRLLKLIADITHDDEADRRLAQHDLDTDTDQHHWALLRAEVEPDLDTFNTQYHAHLQAVMADASIAGAT